MYYSYRCLDLSLWTSLIRLNMTIPTWYLIYTSKNFASQCAIFSKEAGTYGAAAKKLWPPPRLVFIQHHFDSPPLRSFFPEKCSRIILQPSLMLLQIVAAVSLSEKEARGATLHFLKVSAAAAAVLKN